MAGYEKYNQMASNFGSSFEPEEDEIYENAELTTRSIAEIRDAELVPAERNSEEVIHDQEYVKQELKVDIELIGDVAETIRMDLKQGSKPQDFRAFVEVMKERREHLRDYKDVNKEIAQLERERAGGVPVGGGQTAQTINNTVIMSGNEAFDMILEARDKKQDLDPDKEIKERENGHDK